MEKLKNNKIQAFLSIILVNENELKTIKDDLILISQNISNLVDNYEIIIIHNPTNKTFGQDIQKLIDDLGGAPYVAKSLGICRTTPYGWVRRDFVSSTYLSRIKEAWPTLDLDQYFTEEMNEHKKKRTKRHETKQSFEIP
mgnify:CR=1 FL=1